LTPYVTVIPIYALLQFLIGDPKRYDNKASSVASKRKKKLIKIKRIFGFFLAIVVALGCLFIIFIIDAQVEGNERLRWVFRFL